MQFIRVFLLFFRLGVISEMEYRANFFIQLFQTSFSLVVALGGMAIVYGHTTTLNGWYPYELLALVGVYFIIGGMINTVIQPSLNQFMTDVRNGTLDFSILKPIDSQMLISVRQIRIWKMTNLIMGGVLLVIALIKLRMQFDLVQASLFGGMLVCGGIIVYSFWLILATIAFWFVRVENILVIFQSMYEAGRWPIGIYPGWLKFILTFIVPVAFAVTIPSQALTGRLTLYNFWFAPCLALVLFLIARRFWQFGLKHYSGASA